GDDYELFVQGRLGQETRLSEGSGAWILSAQWSPDSSRVLCTDNAGRLWTVEVASRERRILDTATEDVVRAAQWSQDGSWVCYTKRSANGWSSVWLARADGKSSPVQVTSD